MPNTHYYALIGDLHVRGPKIQTLDVMDPILGQAIDLLSAPTPALELNAIIRGATSGAIGRITKVKSTTQCIVESMPHPVFGVPGGAFTAGETVSIDNGGTSVMGIAGAQQLYPLFRQVTSQLLDEQINTYTPDDQSAPVYWDQYAKDFDEITLDGTTISPGEEFLKGDRCSTSGGATFTIFAAGSVGGDWKMWIMRRSGTLTVGHTVTNTSRGSGAWQANIKTVDKIASRGRWLVHHPMPNLRGAGFFEHPPGCEQPDLGPGIRFIRKAHKHHVAATDPNDRGVRVMPFTTSDYYGAADSVLGGVTVQVVKCSGTFPTSWIAGETVTCGSWTAVVHGFSATNKYLFVRETNGEVLAGGTVTGATSSASATCSGPAFGWQKGSAYWNKLTEQITAVLAAPDALHLSQAVKWEGLVLMPWEAETMTFSASVGASWPNLTNAQNAWVRFLTDLREYLGDANIPVALWQQDARSRPSVNVGGVPYALYLRLQVESLRGLVPKLSIIKSDGVEFAHDATVGVPTPLSEIYLRVTDYLELGDRAWRAMLFQNTAIAPGNFEMFPIVVVGGQSQQVGSIPAQALMNLDKNAALYPAASFPGANTIDQNVLSFNSITGAWEPFDITQNANHFFGMAVGTCGPETPLMFRQKKRWSKVLGQSARIGLIKLAVNASSVNAAAVTAPATWDPTITTSPQTTASCTVTVQAGTMLLPPRGRFTAAAGTFSSWTAGAAASVTGSALGVQGVGGNNTAQYGINAVWQVAGDGSWVELIGTFVAEGPRSFTLTMGPRALAPLVEDVVRRAFIAATELRLIPVPMLLVWENGEADVALAAQYKEALRRVLEWLERILGGRLKGQTAIGKVIVQLSANTPMPVPDATVEQIRTAQAELAAELQNAVVVDPSRLPMEAGFVVPATQRQHNGVHRTAIGHLDAGFLVDQAAGTLIGIPSHPDGEAAVVFSTVGGGAGTDTDGAGTDFAGSEEPVGSDLVVEDGNGLADADSYLSLVEADSFAARRGSPTEWTDATDAERANWLRQSAAYGVDLIFEGQLSGTRTSENQALAWPRCGARDRRSRRALPSTTIPAGWKAAQFEFALSLALGVDPLENINPADSGERERFATSATDKLPGGLETSRTYDANSAPSSPILTRMHALAAPFLDDSDVVGLA